MECRCGSVTVLQGDEALVYANEHLMVHWRESVASWVDRPGSSVWSDDRRQRWIAETSGHGFGECQCPFTGWRFQESWHPDPSERELRRRPWTTREDYLRHGVVADRAAQVAATHRLVDETFARRDRSADHEQRWANACDAAEIARETLYSPDLDDLIYSIPLGEVDGIEAGIVFLEVDPWVFRSGYMKRKILMRLARARLGAADRERLQQFLLSAVTKGRRSEFGEMLRLAHHVRSAAFADEVGALASGLPPGPREAALRMEAAVRGTRRTSERQTRRRRRRG